MRHFFVFPVFFNKQIKRGKFNWYVNNSGGVVTCEKFLFFEKHKRFVTWKWWKKDETCRENHFLFINAEHLVILNNFFKPYNLRETWTNKNLLLWRETLITPEIKSFANKKYFLIEQKDFFFLCPKIIHKLIFHGQKFVSFVIKVRSLYKQEPCGPS